MNRTLLIDGDCIAWMIAWQADDVANRTINYIRRLERDIDANTSIVCLSDPTRHYFRHDLLATYKANRSETPAELPTAFEAMRLNFICRTLPGLEADDVMGVLATHETDKMGERVMVGIDKDLRTIPGLHFNPRKLGIAVVGEREATLAHMTQTLTGDSSDGYSGCPGIGAKSIGRILWGQPSQWWAQVVCAFKGKGRSAEDALLMARVSRICRACDYDIASRCVIPWTPDRLLMNEFKGVLTL